MIKSFFKFISQFHISIIRMFVIGAISALVVIFNVDGLLDSSLGTKNLVMISALFAGIPMACITFVESFFYFRRKEIKFQKAKKEKLSAI